MKSNYTGCKLYKVTDEETKVIRVLRRKSNIACIIAPDKNLSNKREIHAEELSEYSLLKPNGNISFNIVTIDKDKDLYDIIIMAGKQDDNKDYACCRQIIVNPFSESIGFRSYGLAISRESCMGKIDYDKIKSCNGVVSTLNINVYRDDFKSSIYPLIDSFMRKGDKVLQNLSKRYSKRYMGMNTSVKMLMNNTKFWDEYDRMFNIKHLPTKIEKNNLDPIQLQYLESLISYLMGDIIVIPYWYDININAISSDYIFVRDVTEKLYIISYARGNFIQQKHMNDSEIAKFMSIKK